MAKNVKERPKKVMPISPGRPKGIPNKTTTLLKDAILKAAENAGGGDLVEYLTMQAQTNPGPFLALIGKVLPLQVTGKDGGPIGIETSQKNLDVRILTSVQREQLKDILAITLQKTKAVGLEAVEE